MKNRLDFTNVLFEESCLKENMKSVKLIGTK